MKKRMKSRILSVMLLVAMLLSSTPVYANTGSNNNGKKLPQIGAEIVKNSEGTVSVKVKITDGGTQNYDGILSVRVKDTETEMVKLVANNQMSGDSFVVTWDDLYNGKYYVEAIYYGDQYHSKATFTGADFEVVGQEDIQTGGGSNSDDSTGSNNEDSGNSGGGGNGGGGNSGQTPAIPNANSSNSDSIEWGVITLDPVKGYVSSNYGIMARDNQDKHSKWKLDEISTLIWGGNVDDYWQLQYPNGSVAKGSKSVDQNGNPVENYHWEQVNGKWWIFDSNGYAKMGWVYDPNYQSWFYIDMKKGMRTGWIQVNNQWYYFHESSDSRMGCMYAATRTPDGYYVKEDGAWDGAARQ